MSKRLALIGVALAAVLVCGEVSIVRAHEEKAESTKGTQTPETDKRGTDNSPLVVNTHAIQSKQEAEENAARDVEQHAVNGRIIGLTLAIAVCAGLQFFGILGQIKVYSTQTKIMRDTLGAIGRQATTMDTQAADARNSAATAAITTNATLEAIKRQADAMEKQAKAVRDRERARISVIFPPENPDFFGPTRLDWDEEVELMLGLRLFVHNDGSSKAFQVRAKARFQFQDKEADFTEKDWLQDIAIPDVIRDEDLTSPIVIVLETLVTDREVRAAAIGELDFYIVGEITYQDVFGYPRKTPFRYLWDVNEYEELGGEKALYSAWVNQSPQST
jgi:hypothetical protein